MSIKEDSHTPLAVYKMLQTFWKSLAVSYKHTQTMRSSDLTLQYLPKSMNP